MLAIIEAVAMPPDDNGKQLIQLYSYQREDGAGTVRDANLALDIVNELTDPLDGEESPIIKGEPPRGAEYQPLGRYSLLLPRRTRTNLSRKRTTASSMDALSARRKR